MKKVKAIISTTGDSTYLPFLPLSIYSWNKIGASVIVIVDELTAASKKFNEVTNVVDLDFEVMTFSCKPSEIVTYCQVGRLFGAISQEDNTILVTGDVDMCVFEKSLINDPADSAVITGIDLIPENKPGKIVQIPMCYAAMSAFNWKKALSIREDLSLSENISLVLEPHQPINSGDHWFLDQVYFAKKLVESGIPLIGIERRVSDTKIFATSRADRDYWPDSLNVENILDAHLPRPITNLDNFNKIKRLFETKYPTEDLKWLTAYYNKISSKKIKF